MECLSGVVGARQKMAASSHRLIYVRWGGGGWSICTGWLENMREQGLGCEEEHDE